MFNINSGLAWLEASSVVLVEVQLDLTQMKSTCQVNFIPCVLLSPHMQSMLAIARKQHWGLA